MKKVFLNLLTASALSFAGFASVARAASSSNDRVIAGPADAALTIEEFADFECVYCERGASTMKQVLKDYDGKVNLVFRNLPLEFHKQALPAAKAFSAIRLQSPSKAFAFYTKVFDNQKRLEDEGMAFLIQAAGAAGADVEQMKSDMEGPKVVQILAEDKALAESFHFNGTPSFRIGTESVTGAVPLAEFKKVIDRQLSH